ncbi:hypothetical protein KOF26_02445 [Sphingomonas sp. XMGL2]|uniref:PsiF repeat-containing protein n=2 Tax=Sphingomonas quercus TaxID=2842451 RepID=A0ABS6BEH4_9SPHN|nr:hypothetical protein [Sphingomonas quercus]
MLILTAAALGLATPALALAQDAPATPPASDQSASAGQGASDGGNYPTCSRSVKDKCVQRGAKGKKR